MATIGERLNALGLRVPEVYLPRPGIDPRTWAVVACDQYSSEREYWERVSSKVGDSPSTLRLIFPECYLEDAGKEARIDSIRRAMESYLHAGILESKGEGFVLVERSTPYEKKPRIGLVLSVDLERYSYDKGSKSLIRPTEGTIVERLPPRMAIRRNAPLELPHILLLVDDPERSVIEPLYERRGYLRQLYDFDLMEGSGHLRGWQAGSDAELGRIAQALEKLADPQAFRERHGSEDVLLFAVGDGNHSLATAKAIWEETKAALSGAPGGKALLEKHPARFALVELLNIYDEGLPFHPIHRVLFGVDEGEFLRAAAKAGAAVSRTSDAAAAFAASDATGTEGAQRAAFVTTTGAGLLEFPQPSELLAAGTVQALIDSFLQAHPKTTVDYIHGEGSLLSLGSRKGNLGLYLPPVDKASFFATIVENGVMPRKTFSMGEAPEKRFYMEARKIVP